MKLPACRMLTNNKTTGTNRTRRGTPSDSVVGTDKRVFSPTLTGHTNQTLIRNFFVVASRNKTSLPQMVERESTSNHSSPTATRKLPSAGATTVSQSPNVHVHSTLSSTAGSPCQRVDFNKKSTVHSKDPPTRAIPTKERWSQLSSANGLARPKRRRRTTPASYEQLYIDLGQRNFAEPTICSVCGMMVVHGLEADIQRHKAVCQAHTLGVSFTHELPVLRRSNITTTTSSHNTDINGNPHPPKHSCAVRIRATMSLPLNSNAKVTTNGHSSVRRKHPLHERKPQRKAAIIEIRPTDSSAMQHKLTQVRAIVDQELGFVEAASRSKGMATLPLTSYLCIVEKRVVGMVLVEPITVAYRLLPSSVKQRPNIINQDDTTTTGITTRHRIDHGTNLDLQTSFAWERATEPCAAVLGIYQLWVHAKHRQCGIASALVDAARRHFVFGYHTVPLNRMAFSSPTEAGVRFAIQYHQSHTNIHAPFDELEVLVYDCT